MSSMASPQPDQAEEERIEALVAARVQKQLAAQALDFGQVLLASTRAGCHALVSAASRGRHELLRGILAAFQTRSNGIPPPDISSDLRKATLAAASNGQSQCLQLLLDSCASPPSSLTQLLDARDDKKCTPLMRAAWRCRVECMRLLLAHSPETQVVAVDGADGRTALMLAACKGQAACVRLLLAHSSEIQISAVDGQGAPALMYAAAGGHLSSLQLLLANSPGAQMAALTAGSNCALVVAASNAHVECVQLLLAHSPSQQQLDTALGEAGQKLAQSSAPSSDEQLRQRYKQCIGLLLSNGAVTTAHYSKGAITAIWPIIKELTARALVPDMANEAVLGLALAGAGRKRQARGVCAAGPSRHARTSCSAGAQPIM